MPAVIVEAFNGKDPKTIELFKNGLHSEKVRKWRNHFVAGVTAGIMDYFSRIKK